MLRQYGNFPSHLLSFQRGLFGFPTLRIMNLTNNNGMSQAAQQQAHCERRVAYARRCCSKASKNFRPSVGARARKSARGAAQVVVGR